MTRKSLAPQLLGAALAVAIGGGIAVAQYGPPQDDGYQNGPPPGNGYDQYYHEGGHADPAAREGWTAGFAQGQSDREHGHSFRPTHTDQYKDVPEAPEGYPHDQFKQEYRHAFVKGYAHGYGR